MRRRGGGANGEACTLVWWQEGERILSVPVSLTLSPTAARVAAELSPVFAGLHPVSLTALALLKLRSLPSHKLAPYFGTPDTSAHATRRLNSL